MSSEPRTVAPKTPSTVGVTTVRTPNTAVNATNRTFPEENKQGKSVNGKLETNEPMAAEVAQSNAPFLSKNDERNDNESNNATSFPLYPHREQQQQQQQQSSQADVPMRRNSTETSNNQSIHSNGSNVNRIQSNMYTAPFTMNMSNTNENEQYAMYSNSPNKAAYARKIKTTDYTDTANINLGQKPVEPNVQSACRPVIHAQNKEEINKGLEQKDQSFYRWYAVPEKMTTNIDQTCFADDVYDVQPRYMYRPVPSMTGICPSMYGIPLPSSLYRMRLSSMGNIITSSDSNNNIIGGFGNPYFPSMKNMGSLYGLSEIRSQPPSLLGSLYSFNGWPANYSMYNVNSSMYNQPNSAGVNSMYEPNMSMYAQNSFYANDNANILKENEQRNANFAFEQAVGNTNINNNNNNNNNTSLNEINNNVSANTLPKRDNELMIPYSTNTYPAVYNNINTNDGTTIAAASTTWQGNNKDDHAVMSTNMENDANRINQTEKVPFEGQHNMTGNMPITGAANTADLRNPELNNTSHPAQMAIMKEKNVKYGVNNSAIPMVVVVCNNGGDRKRDKVSSSSINNSSATTVHTSADSNTPNLVHVDGSTPIDAIVNEAFTSTVAPQEMANIILNSPTFSRLRAQVLLGHSTAVLMANDDSVEGKDVTQGFIVRLISVLNNDLKTENEKGSKSAANYYEMRMLAFAFQTATEGKDLSHGNAVKHVNQEVKLGTNPVFGTTFMKVEDVLVDPKEGENTPEVKKILRELNSVVNFVSNDLPVVAIQFVIKRIVESAKEEPEGTVFLSTVLVLISNNSQVNSMYFDAFTNPAITPSQLTKAAIGGGCVTVALLSLSSAKQHSESAGSALSSLQNISVLGNTPPRSGNVNRFLEYVKREHDKLKNNAKADPAVVKKVEGMLTETKKFMKNPKANEPTLHVLSSQKSSRTGQNETNKKQTVSKYDNDSGSYDNVSAKGDDKNSTEEGNGSKSFEKAKVAVRDSRRKSSSTDKTSRTNSLQEA